MRRPSSCIFMATSSYHWRAPLLLRSPSSPLCSCSVALFYFSYPLLFVLFISFRPSFHSHAFRSQYLVSSIYSSFVETPFFNNLQSVPVSGIGLLISPVDATELTVPFPPHLFGFLSPERKMYFDVSEGLCRFWTFCWDIPRRLTNVV